jgi:hypothetical protein
LKEADKDHAKELEPELLKYLNNITNAVFNDKPARQHVAEFIASRQAVAEPVEPAGPVDLEVVEFNGQDHHVNRETKRVYEGVMGEDGDLKITRPVGYVGMADFKDMVLDEEDDGVSPGMSLVVYNVNVVSPIYFPLALLHTVWVSRR